MTVSISTAIIVVIVLLVLAYAGDVLEFFNARERRQAQRAQWRPPHTSPKPAPPSSTPAASPKNPRGWERPDDD